jgi:hypothetical protein
MKNSITLPRFVRTNRKTQIFHKAMQSTNLPAAAPVPVCTNRKALIRRLLVREDTNQGGGHEPGRREIAQMGQF